MSAQWPPPESMTPPLVVDLFAGGGGAGTGVARALGRSADFAVNHDPAAVAMYRRNHPSTTCLLTDVFDVSPRTLCGKRRPKLVWASPDCFPAGTLVLTSAGYLPIESIEVGALVLTHRGRWRRVTATMSSVKDVRMVSGFGHPGLTVSNEHPFLVSRRSDVWDNAKRQYARTFAEPSWVAAGELTPLGGSGACRGGDYWASPCSFDSLPIPPIGGRALDVDERLMWLAGRYVADGWTRIDEARAEVVITCGNHKVDEARRHLGVWPRAGRRCGDGELAWTERQTSTAYQFAASHRGLVTWLRGEFGHLAHAKRIPGWVLGANATLRGAFMAGYLSGDGYFAGARWEASTVSAALAFGLRNLAESLGHFAAVYHGERGGCIQGRKVTTRPVWREVVTEDRRQHHPSGIHNFTAIKSVSPTYGAAEVFNISVEEDESYVVEGVVVHNCTHFSRAKGAAPRSAKIRGLAWVAADWAREVQPEVMIIENVREFLTWGPLDAEGQPDKARAGETFAEWLQHLTLAGYHVDWRILRACDYGTPTIRERLYIIARSDGRPIVWPEPTHGPGLLPYRTAAECIDWSIPTRSIFDRRKPLAVATQRRIAEGLRRFVIEAAEPFIAPLRGTSPAHRSVHDINAPLSTVSAGGTHHALVVPWLANTRNGEAPGQTPRVRPLAEPYWTTTAKGSQGALVTAWISKHFTGVVGSDLRKPLGTVTAKDHNALTVAATYGDNAEAVAAFLVQYYGSGSAWQSLSDPMRTVVTKARFGLVEVAIGGERHVIHDINIHMLEPRELARANGLPDSQELTGTKAQQIARIGNMVCPDVAEALVRANVVGVRVAA